MVVFFEWLDAHPALYWTAAWGSFALVLFTACAARPSPPGIPARKWIAHPLLFAGLVCLTLCAFRWPSWFVPWELNPDESQIIAGAITLRENPVFWKSVDGTTHGPLNEYILTIASVFGLPLSYSGVRGFASLLIGCILLAVWGSLRRLLPEHLARLGIVPGLAFWSFSWIGDFLHFSSELVAILLLALALWSACVAFTSAQARPGLLGLTGALLTAVPLAKLQAAPLALFMGATSLCLLVWPRRTDWRRNVTGLLGGVILVAVVLLVYLAVFGLLAQFWYSYVVSNLDYAEARNHRLAEMPNHFLAFMTTGQSFAWFFHGCVAFSLLQAQQTWRTASPQLRAALVAGWLGVAVAYFCVLAPGRQVAHYLQFLVVPLAFLSGLHLWAARPADGSHPGPPRLALLLFLVLALAPQGVNRFLAVQAQLGHLAEFRAKPMSDAGRFLSERQHSGDLLTVWGWNAQLHIETQMPQGTREAHSAFQIMRGPLRDFYRGRYLRDMTQNRPKWFVDAVGPRRFAFEYRDIDGHETFPELGQLIRDQYVFLAELESMRIYRRVR
ncbi:MAG TPA: hypothetical protein VHN79_14095 [Lacunisphaera sp.]|nr:hypothetical protein [Lacunisphaera sp.]